MIFGASYEVFSGPDSDRILMLKATVDEPESNNATKITAVDFDESIAQVLALD